MEKIGSTFGSLGKGAASIALSGLLLGLSALPAQADKVMNSPDEAVEVKLNHSLSTETARYGDPFDGTLKETHQLGEKALPAGTLIKGTVRGGHPSMILGMPGYVAFDINEAILPSGTVYQFNADGKGLKTHKHNHHKAKTGKRIMMAGIPFSAVSALDAVPLKFAAGMGFWEITPISLAARMALGVGLEMNDKKKKSPAANYPVQTRVGYGMLRGTGLTGAYQFVKTGPELDLKEGDIIPVRLPKEHMAKLFEAGEAVKTVDASSQDEPVAATPVSPVSIDDLKPAEVDTQSFETVHGKIPGNTASVVPAASAQEKDPEQPTTH